jgi:hypothetical protein
MTMMHQQFSDEKQEDSATAEGEKTGPKRTVTVFACHKDFGDLIVGQEVPPCF